MLDLPEEWAGGVEDLVREANARLATLLPADRAARPKDRVNARLVRHYTTQGLLVPPRREGREARYRRVHLLNLLALRRLMADGLGGRSLSAALSGRSEDDFARLATQGSGWGEGRPQEGQEDRSPLAFVQRLRQSVAALPTAAAEDVLAAPSLLPRPPAPAPRLTSTPRVERVTRLPVVPGLVLEVGAAFRLPGTERERLRLLGTIWDELAGERDEE